MYAVRHLCPIIFNAARHPLLPLSHLLLSYFYPSSGFAGEEGVVIHGLAGGAGEVETAEVGCVELDAVGFGFGAVEVEIGEYAVVADVLIVCFAALEAFGVGCVVVHSHVADFPTGGEYLAEGQLPQIVYGTGIGEG